MIMRMLTRVWMVFLAGLFAASAIAQSIAMSKEELIRYTPDWKGERFADGRG